MSSFFNRHLLQPPIACSLAATNDDAGRLKAQLLPLAPAAARVTSAGSASISKFELAWQRLRHPYIVPLIEIDMDSFPSSLYMCVAIADIPHSIDGVSHIREIAQGLAFLHDQDVVYGDLRGSNILMRQRRRRECAPDATEVLTPNTCGLEDYKRTSASDIYVFACACLQLNVTNASTCHRASNTTARALHARPARRSPFCRPPPRSARHPLLTASHCMPLATPPAARRTLPVA
ncbi:hypothetical protein GGX14DRAFT_563237 [Mycena pura]|uniref:Uncharacterized protein n=1 Tax=Mycena pura TaxID=153505 RepID=A0AAD6YE23_9AGAR|nr:hypothetical protein GGX14DRAFT_563237 [Mycena pura]